MRHCSRCDIDYTGDLDRCPLCASELTGEVVPSPFPCIPMQRVSRRARYTLLAITAILMAVFAAIWFAFGLSWEIGVTGEGVLVLNCVFLWNLLVQSPNGLRVVKRYFLVLMAMALLAYIGTQSPIISTYVIPFISLGAIAFDAVLLFVMHSRLMTEYAKYVLYDIVFGVVPFVLVLMGAVTWAPLSILCMVAAVLLLAALMIGIRGTVTDETKKLFTS